MSACDDVTRSLADGDHLTGALRDHARACPACAASPRCPRPRRRAATG